MLKPWPHTSDGGPKSGTATCPRDLRQHDDPELDQTVISTTSPLNAGPGCGLISDQLGWVRQSTLQGVPVRLTRKPTELARNEEGNRWLSASLCVFALLAVPVLSDSDLLTTCASLRFINRPGVGFILIEPPCVLQFCFGNPRGKPEGTAGGIAFLLWGSEQFLPQASGHRHKTW